MFEMYLSSADEAHMMDKKIHDKPMTRIWQKAEQKRVNKLYGLRASLMRGESSEGFQWVGGVDQSVETYSNGVLTPT